MDILYVYRNTQPTGIVWSSLSSFSISPSLNILLTLMIVIRLTLTPGSFGQPWGGTGSGGLCKATVTVFIESCAIYAVIISLVLGLLSAGNGAANIFTPILAETQVRAFPRPQSSDGSPNNYATTGWTGLVPLFVIHRVANRSALTSNSLVFGCLSAFQARSRGEFYGREWYHSR